MSDNRYNNKDDGRKGSSRNHRERAGNRDGDGRRHHRPAPAPAPPAHAAAASSRYNDRPKDNQQQQQQQEVADGTRRMNHHRHEEEEEESGGGRRSSHDYEMDKQKAQREAERRAKMARLRSENEQEGRKLAPLEQDQQGGSSDGDDDDAGDNNGQRKRKKRDSTTTTTRPQEELVQVNEQELQGLDEEEQMHMLLGIQGFGSTKGQKVESNHNSSAAGAAAKNKARKYRQYMNRKNGFNRPLDKMDWFINNNSKLIIL